MQGTKDHPQANQLQANVAPTMPGLTTNHAMPKANHSDIKAPPETKVGNDHVTLTRKTKQKMQTSKVSTCM
jgi:hypothetical protein